MGGLEEVEHGAREQGPGGEFLRGPGLRGGAGPLHQELRGALGVVREARAQVLEARGERRGLALSRAAGEHRAEQDVQAFGVALGRPEEAAFAAFLIFSFIGTGASFLAYAIIAAKRGVSTEARGKKSFFHLGGLTEGTETIGCFVAICLFPDLFPWIAGVFGAMCWLTTASRIAQAVSAFRD